MQKTGDQTGGEITINDDLAEKFEKTKPKILWTKLTQTTENGFLI